MGLTHAIPRRSLPPRPCCRLSAPSLASCLRGVHRAWIRPECCEKAEALSRVPDVRPERFLRSPLLANQSQHVLAHLEARPPEGVVAGGIALQAKRGIVREQRAHGFDAAAAEH